VCRIGPAIAEELVAARPLHGITELEAVRYVGDSTVQHMLGRDGSTCASKGSVASEWCGLAEAECSCDGAETDPVEPESPNAYVITSSAADGMAMFAAETFYLANADFIWEEFCQGAYNHDMGYNESDVINYCEYFVTERYYPAVSEASMELIGGSYADEASARAAVAEWAEELFLENIDGWLGIFDQELFDLLADG
jgi:hypothetical protein